jgi:hypothetical protein
MYLSRFRTYSSAVLDARRIACGPAGISQQSTAGAEARKLRSLAACREHRPLVGADAGGAILCAVTWHLRVPAVRSHHHVTLRAGRVPQQRARGAGSLRLPQQPAARLTRSQGLALQVNGLIVGQARHCVYTTATARHFSRCQNRTTQQPPTGIPPIE